MSYNAELQSNNEELEEILRQVNELPEASSAVPGEDGFSPIATVTQTSTGAIISITDKSGTTTATVTNGKDGSDGQDGYTPQKNVDYFDGEDGKDGANGKDGTSATHSWNGTTLTVTSASGTSSANLKGDKGDKGDTGASGKTPEKGVDYFTAADKEEMVSAVIANLPSDNSDTVEVINIKEKYNLDDTGVMDCSVLINQAISDISSSQWVNKGITLYVPFGTYKLDNPVTVNKSINIKFEGTVDYTGSEFAFIFTGFNHATAEFNMIKALNGSCIALRSDWNNEGTCIQYSTFKFNVLKALNHCFHVTASSGGWVNENRFIGGKMEEGSYGLYYTGGGGFDGNLIDSCAVEGVDTGFYFADGKVSNNLIFRCRHAESFTTFIKTVGKCENLTVISASQLLNNQISLSEATTGSISANLMDDNYKFCASKANFVRGTLVTDRHYYHITPSGNFDMTNMLGYDKEYSMFNVSSLCSGIKLNKKYGYAGGINEFHISFNKNTDDDFILTDCDGEVILNGLADIAQSVVRFNWYPEEGWKYARETLTTEQIKAMIGLSNYVTNGEAVKTVNNISPDENGNVEIVVVNEEPEVVGSINECADTSKKYVLPDGYIYAYRKKFIPGATTPNFTNQLPTSLDLDLDGIYNDPLGYKMGVVHNYDFTTTKPVEESYESNEFPLYATGLIPIKLGDIVRVNKIGTSSYQGFKNSIIRYYNANLSYATGVYYQDSVLETAIKNGGGTYELTGSGHNMVINDLEFPVNSTTARMSAPAYMSFHIRTTTPPDDVIITVNEEITYTVTEDHYVWEWTNTGEPYVKPDYLAMIAALEERIAALENK